jgi:hypothetical protein
MQVGNVNLDQQLRWFLSGASSSSYYAASRIAVADVERS